MRVTLSDVLQSDLPKLVGLCADDVGGVARAVNRATERLLYAKEGGDSGWIGGWAELALDVSRTDPFIVFPREVARAESINICTFPVPVRNQFYEYLRYGFGRWPKLGCSGVGWVPCPPRNVFDRGNVPTFLPVTGTRKTLRIYPGSTSDGEARVLIQCKDANGMVVRTLDGLLQVQGVFVTLSYPFADLILDGAPLEITTVTGLQKDITIGSTYFYERDLDTGAERLISTMDPGETVASYRRYYLSGLPPNCCNASDQTATTVQVTSLVKLAFIPVRVPTDYVLIPNVEALTLEAQAIRMSGVDGLAAKSEAAEFHRQAIRLLNGQSIAQEGKLSPAISMALFGTAHLSNQHIGQLL